MNKVLSFVCLPIASREHLLELVLPERFELSSTRLSTVRVYLNCATTA
jgi:hypothetical protein